MTDILYAFYGETYYCIRIISDHAQFISELLERDVSGYAIGGLSGGETKEDFWKMVHVSTNLLPNDKPRYLMGVGFAVDLVVCVALGYVNLLFIYYH